MPSKGPILVLLALLAGVSSPALSDDMFKELSLRGGQSPTGSTATGTAVLRYSESFRQLLSSSRSPDSSESRPLRTSTAAPRRRTASAWRSALSRLSGRCDSGGFQQTFHLTSAATYHPTFWSTSRRNGRRRRGGAAHGSPHRPGVRRRSLRHLARRRDPQLSCASVFVDDFEKGDLADWSTAAASVSSTRATCQRGRLLRAHLSGVIERARANRSTRSTDRSSKPA